MATEVKTKEELVAQIDQEWQLLTGLLDPLPAATMEKPALANGWSVKDTLAHLLSWEQYLVQWVAELRDGRDPSRPFSGDDWIDRVNEQVFSEYRDVPLADVLHAFHRAHAGVEALVAELDQDTLFDQDRFPWLQGAPLWRMVAANTFWHYREHRELLVAGLASA